MLLQEAELLSHIEEQLPATTRESVNTATEQIVDVTSVSVSALQCLPLLPLQKERTCQQLSARSSVTPSSLFKFVKSKLQQYFEVD